MATFDQKLIAGLYTAFFNRAPDAAGLSHWESELGAGETLHALAAGFAGHPVFTEQYGEMDDQAFVEAIYTNILGAAGDEEGIAFWVGQLEGGMSRSDFVAEFVYAALNYDGDDAAALERKAFLDNKAEVGVYYAETLGEASNLDAETDTSTREGLEADPAYIASQQAIAAVTADPATVETAKGAIDEQAPEQPPVDDGTLAGKLAVLEAARAEQADAVEALDDLGVTDLTPAGLEAAAAAAEVAVQQANLDLSEARAETAGAAKATDANVASLVTAKVLTDATVLSDANLAKAVTDAQALVNADKALYAANGDVVVDAEGAVDGDYQPVYWDAATEEYTEIATGNKFLGYVPATVDVTDPGFVFDGEDGAQVNVFTALQLQGQARTAANAVAGHEASVGAESVLLANLAESISSYLAQNPAIPELIDYVSTYATELGTAKGDASKVAIANITAELDAALGKILDADGESLLADNARGDAAAAVATQLAERLELIDASDKADAGFKATLSGKELAAAQALVSDRDQLKKDATDAVADQEDLAQAIADYEQASANVEAAEKALGLVIEELDSVFEFATDEADLFLFDAEDSVSTTINGFAGDDVIFLGSDYSLGGETGDNNVLEVFVTEVGGNAVLQIENTPYGSSEGKDGNFTTITLTGVAAADVVVDGGVVTIA